MKQTNKQIQNFLCRYYKGEQENPFLNENNNNKIFWNYEMNFFKNPNVFQDANIEEKFKAYILNALDGPIAESHKSLDKAIREYFGKL